MTAHTSQSSASLSDREVHIIYATGCILETLATEAHSRLKWDRAENVMVACAQVPKSLTGMQEIAGTL